ncbi:MAG: heavy metal-binding domain-containing protein [Bacteroidota bacterium]
MRAFFFLLALIAAAQVRGQGCCSGGSGSPITGGASQGVLPAGQMELASSLQYLRSDRFKVQDRDTAQLFDHFKSNYIYSRLGYGITKNFTLSVEMGYYLNKTQVGLYDSVLLRSDVIESSGIADLIIFPRYNVFTRSDSSRQVELTLGLGYKIPLGKYKDSTLVYTDPNSGQQYYTISPPIVQPTTGSQDLIAYAFFLRGFPKHKLKLFSSLMYIRKGWNPLGEKFGDYGALSLFGSRSFGSLGLTLQLRAEQTGKMKAAENMDLQAFYNVDTASTGSKRISFSPQLSFSRNALTIFALTEVPVYEYVNGAQIATRTQYVFGLSYRFFSKKNPDCDPVPGEAWQCPMKCPGGGSDGPGKCKVCGMDLLQQ